MRDRILFTSPTESLSHRELRAQIAAAGLPIRALRNMLWCINAHCDLIAFDRISSNLAAIIRGIPMQWELPLSTWGMQEWPEILAWMSDHRDQLVLALGPEFVCSPKKGRHPVLGRGANRHPLYAALWNVHKDLEWQPQYLVLQAHVFLAQSTAMQRTSTCDIYEAYAGREGWNPFSPSPREAAIALRFLSTGSPWGIEYLNRIDFAVSPGEIVDQLRDLSPPNDSETIKRHRDLTRFLRRSLALKEWKKRRSNGRRERKRRKQKWVTGYVPLSDQVALLHNPIGDRDDPSTDGGSHIWVAECKLSKAEQESLCDVDDDSTEDTIDDDALWTEHPAEAGLEQGDKRDIKQGDPAEFAVASKSQLRHVEMANQILPCTYNVLTDHEIKQLAIQATGWMRTLPQDRPIRGAHLEQLELLALLFVNLVTGAAVERAIDLRLFLPGTANDNAELALFLSYADPDQSFVAAKWRVRALTPKYASQQQPVPKQDRQRSEYIFFPDVSQGSCFVLRFALDSHKGCNLGPDTERRATQPLRPFRRPIDWYRQGIRRLLAQYDSTGRITETKVVNYLFTRLVETTGGDIAAAALLTGQEHPLAQVRRFYATPSLRSLAEVYTQVARSEADLIHLQIEQIVSPRLRASSAVELSPPGIHVGSRLCPSKNAVREAVHLLKDSIKKAERYSDESGWIRYHNLFTLYSLWNFHYATGMRGIRTPYLSVSSVHEKSGFATVQDKGDKTGYKTRLLWLPEAVLAQMRNYERHLIQISPATRAAASDIVRERTFFLFEGRQPVEVSPKTLRPIMEEFLPFPANVHRRFVRTELLERGCAPEVVDAWIGHWYRGEEPWGEYSSFSFQQFRLALKRHLLPLLEELGFCPLVSRV